MSYAFENVSLVFNRNYLFKNLNLKFSSSDIVAILGPSGCGKSTLLRMLAGLQSPTSGKVLAPAQESKIRQGFIFQESHLLNWRTTLENVQLPLELQNIDDNSRVESVIDWVGLKAAKDLYPSQLSGGMKMRASLARAFVNDPKVLFCDEPFAALDEVTRESLQKSLRARLVKSNITCFFVTHNLTEALSIADKIYYFTSPGQIEAKPFQVNQYAKPEEQLYELRQLVRGSFT